MSSDLNGIGHRENEEQEGILVAQRSTFGPGPKRSNPFTTIPIEIQLNIFKHLDPVPSASLGLCSKALYNIHFELQGKVSLSAFTFWPRETQPVPFAPGYYLMDFLKGEMNGFEAIYIDNGDKATNTFRLISQERKLELKAFPILASFDAKEDGLIWIASNKPLERAKLIRITVASGKLLQTQMEMATEAADGYWKSGEWQFTFPIKSFRRKRELRRHLLAVDEED